MIGFDRNPQLIAVLEDGTEREIDPKRVVFDEESTHHIAVTLYGKRGSDKANLKLTVNGKRLLDVDPVTELKPIGNSLSGSPYYALRLTVLRDWLVEIVKTVRIPGRPS